MDGKDATWSLNASLSHPNLGSHPSHPLAVASATDQMQRNGMCLTPVAPRKPLASWSLELGNEGIYRACRACAHLLLVGGFIGRKLISRGKIKLKPISHHLGGCQARSSSLPRHAVCLASIPLPSQSTKHFSPSYSKSSSFWTPSAFSSPLCLEPESYGQYLQRVPSTK